jgi:hypothetical protein
VQKPINHLQARQDEDECEFIVNGVSDWKSIFTIPVRLSGSWAKLCGGTEVPMMTCLEKEAEMNDHPLERSIVHAFLRLGYVLEELEVDIICNATTTTWGRCIWYREHSNYEQPLPDIFDNDYTVINNPTYYYAMFRTENAGDQHFSLYSGQMFASNSTLFHKSLLYRRVVFSPPKAMEHGAAA